MALSPQHKKRFGVYHWDTFDNETFFKRDFDTQEEAERWIKEEEYQGRLRPSGADKVDVVDKESAEIVLQFSVG
jgi:hypothetical protein